MQRYSINNLFGELFTIFGQTFGEVFGQIFGEISGQIFGEGFDHIFGQVFDNVFYPKIQYTVRLGRRSTVYSSIGTEGKKQLFTIQIPPNPKLYFRYYMLPFKHISK